MSTCGFNRVASGAAIVSPIRPYLAYKVPDHLKGEISRRRARGKRAKGRGSLSPSRVPFVHVFSKFRPIKKFYPINKPAPAMQDNSYSVS